MVKKASRLLSVLFRPSGSFCRELPLSELNESKGTWPFRFGRLVEAVLKNLIATSAMLSMRVRSQ